MTFNFHSQGCQFKSFLKSRYEGCPKNIILKKDFTKKERYQQSFARINENKQMKRTSIIQIGNKEQLDHIHSHPLPIVFLSINANCIYNIQDYSYSYTVLCRRIHSFSFDSFNFSNHH